MIIFLTGMFLGGFFTFLHGLSVRAGIGKEQSECYGNGTCDGKLRCLSGLCVSDPPAGGKP